MPAPTSYTVDELKTFMVAELSSTGTALGLTTASASIVNAVWAVERLLGDDIADLDDMAVLEAAARWEAWKAAKKAAGPQYDLKAGTASLARSQFFEHIAVMLTDAETAYYAAVSASEAESGAGVGFFFGIACGGRGR